MPDPSEHSDAPATREAYTVGYGEAMVKSFQRGE
jgi:hypothetical protein